MAPWFLGFFHSESLTSNSYGVIRAGSALTEVLNTPWLLSHIDAK